MDKARDQWHDFLQLFVMKHLKRLAVLLAVIIAVILLWTYWLQFVVASYSSARMLPPSTWNVPQPLSDTSITQAPTSKLNYVGYEFEVPWADLDESQTKTVPKDRPPFMVGLIFKSGVRMIVSAVPPRSFANNLSAELHWNKDSLEAVLGHGAMDSDYNFHQALYELTPDRMRKWSLTGKQRVDESMLLTIKGVSLSRAANSGIFEIRNQDFKGFQQGNFSAGARQVTCELFDDRGAIVVIVDSTRAQIPVAQPELNRIIQSIRRAS